MKKLARIVWSNSYSVGYDYIDRQHKRLIGMVNTFFDALKAGKAQEVTYPILNGLVSYAEEHFRDEEVAMERAGCPVELIREHKAVHDRLVQDIFEVTKKVTSSSRSSNEALTSVGDLLSTWLLEHILDHDMQYAPYVSKLKGPPE